MPVMDSTVVSECYCSLLLPEAVFCVRGGLQYCSLQLLHWQCSARKFICNFSVIILLPIIPMPDCWELPFSQRRFLAIFSPPVWKKVRPWSNSRRLILKAWRDSMRLSYSACKLVSLFWMMGIVSGCQMSRHVCCWDCMKI